MTEIEQLLKASVEMIELRKKLQSARECNTLLAQDNQRLRERLRLVTTSQERRSSYE